MDGIEKVTGVLKAQVADSFDGDEAELAHAVIDVVAATLTSLSRIESHLGRIATVLDVRKDYDAEGRYIGPPIL